MQCEVETDNATRTRQRSGFPALSISRSLSVSSHSSSDHQVSAQGWTKHLEIGVFHASAPLTTKLSKELSAMLSSKNALQCVEKFIWDLRNVPKHGTSKKGYSVNEFKPVAGHYAGRFETFGIAMFFCSFPNAKGIPHQWFEFVDREMNPQYMPHERLDLPVISYSPQKSERERTEQEGITRCSTTTGVSSNGISAEDSIMPPLSAQADASSSVASQEYDADVRHERDGDNIGHLEECTVQTEDARIKPPPSGLQKPVIEYGFGVPAWAKDCCVAEVLCCVASEVSDPSIEDPVEQSVMGETVSAAELSNLWAKVVDRSTVVDL